MWSLWVCCVNPLRSQLWCQEDWWLCFFFLRVFFPVLGVLLENISSKSSPVSPKTRSSLSRRDAFISFNRLALSCLEPFSTTASTTDGSSSFSHTEPLWCMERLLLGNTAMLPSVVVAFCVEVMTGEVWMTEPVPVGVDKEWNQSRLGSESVVTSPLLWLWPVGRLLVWSLCGSVPLGESGLLFFSLKRSTKDVLRWTLRSLKGSDEVFYVL